MYMNMVLTAFTLMVIHIKVRSAVDAVFEFTL